MGIGDKRSITAVPKFMGAAAIMILAIPMLSSNSKFCVLHIGFIENISMFRILAKTNFVSLDQICAFEGMLILFWFYAIAGCILLRNELRELATEAQRRKNAVDPGPGPAFQIMLWLSIVSAVGVVVVGHISSAEHMDANFAIKQFFLTMLILCCEAIFVGLTIAYI